MEPTLTTSPANRTSSVLDYLLGLVSGRPADGRLAAKIDAVHALGLVRDGATLLDVRERNEWKSGHAPQAVHIPLGEVAQAGRRLPQDRRVVVVCASGARSNVAARQLRVLGYDATSLSGGLSAWQRAGGEVTR